MWCQYFFVAFCMILTNVSEVYIYLKLGHSFRSKALLIYMWWKINALILPLVKMLSTYLCLGIALWPQHGFVRWPFELHSFEEQRDWATEGAACSRCELFLLLIFCLIYNTDKINFVLPCVWETGSFWCISVYFGDGCWHVIETKMEICSILEHIS